MRRKVALVGVLLMLVLVMTSCTTKPPESSSQQAIDLTLTDRNGESKSVDLTQFATVTGEGGYRKSTGTVVGPVELSGVPLMHLLDEIGGITPQDSLKIIASDGYSMTFSYEQARGQVLTYAANGDALMVEDLDVMVAIESSSSDIGGFPRMAFTRSDKPLSDGHLWVKDVVEIKVVPGVAEWALKLSGIEEMEMDRSTFESGATCPNTPHPASTYEKDGDVYTGVPLWILISTVDGADTEGGHYAFNRDLAQEGYTVQVIASDGYTVELHSQQIAYNDNIFLAYLKNDQPLGEEEGPLRLVGSGLEEGQHSVKQVVEIKLVDLPE